MHTKKAFSECVAFFRQFLHHPKQVGAAVPTARFLAERAVKLADVEHADTVVELGSGTGAITERIFSHLKPGATFVAMELNPLLAKETQKRCPGVTVICDSAENLASHLTQRNISSVDAIVSAIPWACVHEEKQDKLLTTISDVLKPGGRFTTLAYPTAQFTHCARQFRKKFFHTFENAGVSNIVWQNIPPGFVYYGEKRHTTTTPSSTREKNRSHSSHNEEVA